MKFKLMTAIGLLILVASCQKENVVVNTEAETAVSVTSSEVQEALPNTGGTDTSINDDDNVVPAHEVLQEVDTEMGTGTESENENNGVIPAHDVLEEVKPDMSTTDEASNGDTGVVPPSEVLESVGLNPENLEGLILCTPPVDGALNNEPLANNKAIVWSENPPKGEHWIFPYQNKNGDIIACPYPDCDTSYSSLLAQYQAQANEACEDLFLCVACCVKDQVYYASFVVRHQCSSSPVSYQY